MKYFPAVVFLASLSAAVALILTGHVEAGGALLVACTTQFVTAPHVAFKSEEAP